MKKRKVNLAAILCAPPLFIGTLCLFSAGWYLRVFGKMSYIAMITTLTFDAGSTEKGMILSYVAGGLLPAVIAFAAIMFLLFCPVKRGIILHSVKKAGKGFKIFPLPKFISAPLAVIMSAVFVLYAAYKTDLISYFVYIFSEPTAFFEQNYVDPGKVSITFPENKRNLIMIYLESMETSLLPENEGGGNDVNPIPELCRLADENINFSQHEGVGGFTSPYGSEWTIAALVAFSSGVPLKLPDGFLTEDANTFGSNGRLLPGVKTLNDILKENGYYQAFLCGSEASFGNRKTYYLEHGVDDIFDLPAAKKEGIVPANYGVWWGMEDLHVFEYAKKKLTEMAAGDKPFALSMLTSDTHHVGGYYCELCKNQFPEQYENVFACSSRQVYEFVNWIKEQDFYENTAVVILGDHPSMDNEYITKNIVSGYERKVYNCFINSSCTTGKIKNRSFLTFDIFPTVLAAMGCEIEGNRLGLGCNLFSAEPSLGEVFTNKDINEKLAQKSDYYNKFF